MLYIESPSTDPCFNLALEEYVFDQMDKSDSYLMLWQNDSAVIVGRYQNTAEEINQDYVDSHRIMVVRRLSGGGAVYHDKGNLNYSFITDCDSSNPNFNFRLFAEPVIKALTRFGVISEFNGRNDVTINGMKFSGNAQYIRRGRLLHHGCIMLNSDLTVLAGALKARKSRFESKAVKSVRSRVTNINAHAPVPIPMAKFRQTLLECFTESEKSRPYLLTEADITAVNKLRDGKYATWEWNYGASPEYDMRREMKFPSALVSVRLNAGQGKIKSVRFYGDFFSSGELGELEQSLEGLPLDENLEAALEPLRVGHYMNGITAADLSRLLRG